MITIGLVLALIIGLTLGLFGGGGSTLTVPIFVYVLGFDAKLAVAMSFPVVGATSFIGAVGHWRAGNIRLANALIFGLVTMTGAYGGARASRLLDGRTQLLILGAVMAVAAVMMMRSAQRDATEATVPEAPSMALYAVGLAVGALTGAIGIGGGFLLVPALVGFGKVPMREAVGTSLLVISMNCVSGFAGQRLVLAIPWLFVCTFSAVAIVGILAGARLGRFVPQRTLKRGFAVLLLVIGVLVLWQNHAKL
ncbi:MAG: sulfite exporter TauE/SafE family protein [Gemmatimonadales bacterium]